MPSDPMLEGLYKSQLQNSAQLRTVMALYDHARKLLETMRHRTINNWKKTAVKLHIDQMMRTQNFRVRNEVVERGSVTKSHRRKGSHAGSVMTQWPLATVAVVRDEKDDRLLPHQIRRPRLTKGENSLKKHQATQRKVLQTKGAKFHADAGL